MKFTLKEASTFSNNGIKGWNYLAKEDFASASLSLIKASAPLIPTKNTHSNRIYYLLEGKGVFSSGQEYPVTVGDVIIIPKNTPYLYEPQDQLTLLEVNVPPLDLSCEEKVSSLGNGKLLKFSLEEARPIGWEGLNAWAYSSKEDFGLASAIYFEVTGRHGKIKTTLSDRIYYVVGGKGYFVIKGDATSVEEGDVIIVPKNTPYDYYNADDVLKLFLIHTPAYDKDHEVYYDKHD